MRKFGLVLFAAALILIPELAMAGKAVPEPGTVSQMAVGLLGIAGVSGTLTVREILRGRRKKDKS